LISILWMQIPWMSSYEYLQHKLEHDPWSWCLKVPYISFILVPSTTAIIECPSACRLSTQWDYHALYGDKRKAPADKNSFFFNLHSFISLTCTYNSIQNMGEIKNSAHYFSDLKYFPVNDGIVWRTCHV
jgi:hypothetical protein